MITADYDNNEYMPDSTRKEIEAQQPINVKGLYFVLDNGEKVTPDVVWFGCHFVRWDGEKHYGGTAWCHTYNALYPVFTADGERYRVPQLRNVCAEYNGETLYEFYKQ